MLGSGNVLICLHSIHAHMQSSIAKFNHTHECVISVYLFNNNMHICYIPWTHMLAR
jgi:hypothetical protein